MKAALLVISLVMSAYSLVGKAELNTQELLDVYHGIQTSLANDHFPEAQNLSGKSLTALNHWLKEAATEEPRRADVQKMIDGATALAKTSVEEEQRKAFSVLSEGIVGFIRKDKGLQTTTQLFFCPMFAGFAYWVQPKGEKINNPYMGTQMPMCGSKKPW